jgi:adenine phosphoribosyltransferase
MDYKKIIRDLPDYPVKGVVFKDLTTLFNDSQAFYSCMNDLMEKLQNLKINKVVGIEARGFIIGSIIAYAMEAAFVPIRKKKKLPWKVFSQEYALEYGTDSMEIHQDAFSSKDRILIADDLLATGGTTEAALKLIANFKDVTVVGAAYLVELTFLKGKDKVNCPIYSVIQY